MKRSEVNALIDDAIRRLHAHGITLPPFAYWTPADWTQRGPECDEIRHCKLGWDITDFGSNTFERIGLVVFTVRNGHHQLPAYSGKRYAEKLLIIRPDQHTPMHHHRRKAEDIICRSGGNIACRVFNRSAEGGLAPTAVDVSLDGVRHHVEAGHEFLLTPGTSITLTPFLWHEFWAVGDTCIAGEVSSVNDDESDNDFLERVGRFPLIDEDVPASHKLCTEY